LKLVELVRKGSAFRACTVFLHYRRSHTDQLITTLHEDLGHTPMCLYDIADNIGRGLGVTEVEGVLVGCIECNRWVGKRFYSSQWQEP